MKVSVTTMNLDLNEKRTKVIQNVCESLTRDEMEMGRSMITRNYPFEPKERHPRNYSNYRKFTIFRKDGFIDRYSGERLVFPGVLKVLSNLYPQDFPYHKNGKMTLGHIAYWRIMPTVDHVHPYAAGGCNDDDNLVTTSMLHNGMKSGYSLEELGWELHPRGDPFLWDGLSRWFYDYVSRNRSLLNDDYVNIWYKVLLRTGQY